MAYVTECEEHDRCTLIVSDGWPDEAGSWRSHFEDDVPAEARLNPDDPEQAEVEDRRKSAARGATLSRREPNVDERKRLDGQLPDRLPAART